MVAGYSRASQWFANIYLHEVDWYAKQVLKIPYYLRYNDDILIIGTDPRMIAEWSRSIQWFACDQLRLTIPSRKVALLGLPQPIDILGLVTNGDRVWVRPHTVRRARERMTRAYSRLASECLDTLSSYYGCGVPTHFSPVDGLDAYI